MSDETSYKISTWYYIKRDGNPEGYFDGPVQFKTSDDAYNYLLKMISAYKSEKPSKWEIVRVEEKYIRNTTSVSIKDIITSRRAPAADMKHPISI